MAVCTGGDCYGKYEESVVNRYGKEMDAKVKRFLNKLSINKLLLDEKRSITTTYTSSLKRLGNDIGLSKTAFEEIVRWQEINFIRNQNKERQSTVDMILVIANNVSMNYMHPLRISKADFVEAEVHRLINNFTHYKYNNWNNFQLAIINYAERADVSTWPTPLRDVDNLTKIVPPTRGRGAHISEGLETAMLLASKFGGQNQYSRMPMVLVSDGYDDDPARTQAVLDTIRGKRTIELYAYFVDTMTNQQQNDWLRNAFYESIGCVSLRNDMVHSLNWWFTRDILLFEWYEQESYYRDIINHAHHQASG